MTIVMHGTESQGGRRLAAARQRERAQKINTASKTTIFSATGNAEKRSEAAQRK